MSNVFGNLFKNNKTGNSKGLGNISKNTPSLTSSPSLGNTSRNLSLTPSNSKGKTVLIYSILGVIFLASLIAIIIYLVKKANDKKNNVFVIVKDPLDAFDIQNKDGFKVDNSDQGLEFSYSVWIFIQDWTRGWKNIFVKGDRNNNAGSAASRAPGLWLYPDTNALHARINTFASPNEGCDIKNIPLQKWVHIAYILNNRTVDMYIDGKLERSCVLRGVPKLNNQPLYVCDNGGYFGKISNLVYYKYALQPNEVYDIYSQGPY